MTKGSRSRRNETRWSPTQSLDHTVSTPRRPLSPIKSSVRSTLMRTVLGDTDEARQRKVSPSFPASQKRNRSPVVAVRATGRSSDLRIKSPFLNATMLTPELTQRSMECARRTIRREVLFAKKGLSGSSPKRRRSKVRC